MMFWNRIYDPFCFVAAFNISRNHGNQALYLSEHHYWQMTTYNILWAWCENNRKQFEHLFHWGFSDQS